MKNKLTITGKIVDGGKNEVDFTQLEWVQEQCQRVIGANPFPATLHLKIAGENVLHVQALLQTNGIALTPPDSDSCVGHLYPVSIMGVSGAIVTGSNADLQFRDPKVIELIASTCLKAALDVDEGDEILFVVKHPAVP